MQNVNNLEYLGIIILSSSYGQGIGLSLGLAKQKCATTLHHSI